MLLDPLIIPSYQDPSSSLLAQSLSIFESVNEAQMNVASSYDNPNGSNEPWRESGRKQWVN